MKNKKKVFVIGSGISGIMSAKAAVEAGYKVELFSKSPDPRIVKDKNSPKESSTFDSKNDQRYITVFEGHPYLELDGYVNKVYPNIAEDFQTNVLSGGVLSVDEKKYDTSTQDWLHQRKEVNDLLLIKNKAEVKNVKGLFEDYTKENRAAMEKWYLEMTRFIERHPDLSNEISLHSKSILRLYDNEEVFHQSVRSHKKEKVFIKKYSPEQLAEIYPAYAEGVKRGFIVGGALEMYGLAFSVGIFCRTVLDDLEKLGVVLHFNIEVEKVLRNKKLQVKGIVLFNDKKLYKASHYIFHTGAFVGPELFSNIPEAQGKLAAVEGYWITVKNADKLVAQMGNIPNKVHGKKSLAEILAMVSRGSAKRYKTLFLKSGVSEKDFDKVAPIVDFNNMPLRDNGGVSLGVGSGYIFKGLATRNKLGKVEFKNDVKSETFVVTVMELWLEALHGKKLLPNKDIIVYKVGCKRSYTPDDKELDVNIETDEGGLCMIHDGGNTGSTTKSTFIASYIVEKMKKVEASNSAKLDFSKIRKGLAKSAWQVPTYKWKKLSNLLLKVMSCVRS